MSARQCMSRWEDLVSPKVGLVTDLSPQMRGAEEPVPPFLYTATLAHFDFRTVDRQERLNRRQRTAPNARQNSPRSAKQSNATRPIIGIPARRFSLAKRSELGAAISPAECVLYADEQYCRAGLHLPALVGGCWRPAGSTASNCQAGREVALPASLSYLVFPFAARRGFLCPGHVERPCRGRQPEPGRA